MRLKIISFYLCQLLTLEAPGSFPDHPCYQGTCLWCFKNREIRACIKRCSRSSKLMIKPNSSSGGIRTVSETFWSRPVCGLYWKRLMCSSSTRGNDTRLRKRQRVRIGRNSIKNSSRKKFLKEE